jgi:Med18 protein
MYEFSLYGQVPGDEHGRMLQQLAGVARMQPKPTQEVHLVFRSQTPPALADPGTGPSGEKLQEYQRVMRMLNNGLYYVQVVGRVNSQYDAEPIGQATNSDVEMTDDEKLKAAVEPRVRWYFEFKDTPDAGKQMVSTRLIARVAIEGGDVMKFMKQLGYE